MHCPEVRKHDDMVDLVQVEPTAEEIARAQKQIAGYSAGTYELSVTECPKCKTRFKEVLNPKPVLVVKHP